MSYRVYKAYFNRPGDPHTNFDRHVALFIRTGLDPDQYKGNMFHVIEGVNSSQGHTVLSFDVRSNCVLDTHRSFYEAKLIGTVPKGKLEKFQNVCQNLPDVIAPEDIDKPNCVTWVDNAIYDLNKDNVVIFESSFKVPLQKKDLQVVEPSSTAKNQGSSSSSKKSGSSSSTKH